MEVRFLGGAGEIGRSAVLVNGSLLLDYGTTTDTPPKFPLESARGVDPEAVVVSHGHLDHAGAVPALLSGDARPTIHWTPPTYELTMTLARDTLKLHGLSWDGPGGRGKRGGSYACPFTEEECKRVTQVSETHGYAETFEAAGHEVTLYDAGHVPGSAHVLVDDGETRLLYTGDFYAAGERGRGQESDHEESGRTSRRDGSATHRYDGRSDGNGAETDGVRGQRLVAPSTARPDADAVVVESTYADTVHEDRREVERRFVESVKTTLWEGGTVVVPAFAIGRTQELLLVCERHDIDCYVDGMGQEVTRLFRQYPAYVRDPERLRRAKSHARFVNGRDGQRERIADKSTVVVTTSGMLSGGPAMTYVPEIRHDPTNKIALSGYQVAGTPGRQLVDTGRAEIDGRVMPVSAQVETYDFSAHADRRGLEAFLDAYRDSEILVNHGDDCAGFAADLREQGLTASAPELDETVVV